MTKAKLEKSAGAVVFRRENDKIYYLLLQHEAGHWGFPKGIIEKGENLQETAKREIREETGLNNIKFIEGFKEREKYFYKLKGKGGSRAFASLPPKGILKIVTYLLAQTKQREVKLSFEHIGYQWLAYDGALERLTFQNSQEVLKKANKFLNY